MTNQNIATLLRNVAAAYSIQNEAKYRFQIIAYQKAADAIESSTSEIKDLIQDDTLDSLPGIGQSMRTYLEELIKTGKVSHFESILKEVPEAVFPILQIPSFGPKKAFKLVSHFHLDNAKSVIEELYTLASENKIASLEGFGEKSQADIKRAIEEFRQGVDKTSRMALPFAQEIADKIVAYLKKSPYVQEAYPLGSLRRQKETIGDVDIAVATTHPAEVLSYFIEYPYKDRVIEKGDASASLLISGGKHIDLMVQPPERFGSLLQHFSGSKEHNVHLREYALKKGLSLSEYGIKAKNDSSSTQKTFKTEESFYKEIGLQWIPPELREDTGEIELASNNQLPELVTLKDIKGDFHIHSDFPIEPSHDLGKNTMEEMIEKAIELDYEYIGFSEHNPSVSKHTEKEINVLLEKRNNKIEQLKETYSKRIRIFSLLETDILANGSIALSNSNLEYLDAILVSIHSSFSLPKAEMTKRVLKGLSHPKAKILSHPTARLINQRPMINLEWNDIFTFCKEHNKALEINASPFRLDLPDQLVKSAIEKGVKCFIDTDSHAVDQMQLMQFGVSVARRGWATKHDILNTQEYTVLSKWFKNQK
jgi:DNA polymerase (family 10)